MTPLKALKESIAHWKRLATGKRGIGEYHDCTSCALCEAYLYDKCNNCPVKLKTGRRFCVGSPWHNADKQWERFGYDSPQFKKAATVQLEFLKSLLPKKGEK